MAPRVDAMPKSESKRNMLARIGLDETNPADRRAYDLMKQEASVGRQRLIDRLLASAGGIATSEEEELFPSSSVEDWMLSEEAIEVYGDACDTTRRWYDLAHDPDEPDEPNWIVRWFLWHVFRYRDGRQAKQKAEKRRQSKPQALLHERRMGATPSLGPSRLMDLATEAVTRSVNPGSNTSSKRVPGGFAGSRREERAITEWNDRRHNVTQAPSSQDTKSRYSEDRRSSRFAYEEDRARLDMGITARYSRHVTETPRPPPPSSHVSTHRPLSETSSSPLRLPSILELLPDTDPPSETRVVFRHARDVQAVFPRANVQYMDARSPYETGWDSRPGSAISHASMPLQLEQPSTTWLPPISTYAMQSPSIGAVDPLQRNRVAQRRHEEPQTSRQRTMYDPVRDMRIAQERFEPSHLNDGSSNLTTQANSVYAGQVPRHARRNHQQEWHDPTHDSISGDH